MKPIFKVILATLLLSSNFVFSQKQDSTKFNTSPSSALVPVDSLKAIFNQEAIVFDANGNYYKGDRKFRRGFSNRFLKRELKKSDDANKQYKIFALKRNRGMAIFFGSYIAGFAVTIATSNPAGLLLWIPGYFGLLELTQSNTYFNKAIANYNRDAIIDRAKKIGK